MQIKTDVRRRVRRSLATGILAGVVLAAGASGASAAYDPADPAQKAAYDQAFDIGVQAFDYAVPVISMNRVFLGGTSANVSDGRGVGPVNQFNIFKKLADAKDRYAVGPNNDTLYSDAWLDLSKGPLVLHMDPSPKRFRYFEMLSPWQENFQNIGSPQGALKGTDFLVTAPGWKGKVPKGVKRVRSPYDRAWVVGRVFVKDATDVPEARRISKRFIITPLKKWDPKHPTAYRPKPPKVKDKTVTHPTNPGTQPGEDPLTFFDAANVQLKRFPGPAADAPILAKLKAYGIGAGLPKVSTSTALSEAQKAGLAAAVTGAPARLQARLATIFLGGFDLHNGWLVITDGGHYGTNYAYRAVIDRFGFGLPTPNAAIYPLALTDRTKSPLTGKKRYVVHFPAEDAKPPVQFFWSLTIYDSELFFVPNLIDRWLVNNRSGLKYNPDGSLDIYVQPNAPTSAAQQRNWLPSPQADAANPGFRLMMRLYGVPKAKLGGITDGTGWQSPSILPCGPDGTAAGGIPCAS